MWGSEDKMSPCQKMLRSRSFLEWTDVFWTSRILHCVFLFPFLKKKKTYNYYAGQNIFKKKYYRGCIIKILLWTNDTKAQLIIQERHSICPEFVSTHKSESGIRSNLGKTHRLHQYVKCERILFKLFVIVIIRLKIEIYHFPSVNVYTIRISQLTINTVTIKTKALEHPLVADCSNEKATQLHDLREDLAWTWLVLFYVTLHSIHQMHTDDLHAYGLTVSMATKGSHLVGNLWAHPVDVTQH